MEPILYCQQCGGIMQELGMTTMTLRILDDELEHDPIEFEVFVHSCTVCGSKLSYEIDDEPPEEYFHPPAKKSHLRLIVSE